MGIEDIVPGKSRKPTKEEEITASVNSSPAMSHTSYEREKDLEAFLEVGKNLGLTEDEIKEVLSSFKEKQADYKVHGNGTEVAFNLRGHEISYIYQFPRPKKPHAIDGVPTDEMSAEAQQNLDIFYKKFSKFFNTLDGLRMQQHDATHQVETEKIERRIYAKVKRETPGEFLKQLVA